MQPNGVGAGLGCRGSPVRARQRVLTRANAPRDAVRRGCADRCSDAGSWGRRPTDCSSNGGSTRRPSDAVRRTEKSPPGPENPAAGPDSNRVGRIEPRPRIQPHRRPGSTDVASMGSSTDVQSRQRHRTATQTAPDQCRVDGGSDQILPTADSSDPVRPTSGRPDLWSGSDSLRTIWGWIDRRSRPVEARFDPESGLGFEDLSSEWRSDPLDGVRRGSGDS